MYLESSRRFLLSGFKVRDDYMVISQHEGFPDVYDPAKPTRGQQKRPEGDYVACVKRKTARGNTFQLLAFSCENCDERLGKYSCGQVSGEKDAEDTPRQLLFEVAQSVTHLSPVGVDVRVLDMAIPSVNADLSRAVWCPRCPRGSGDGRSVARRKTPRGRARSNAATAVTAKSGAGSGAEMGSRSRSFRSDTDDSDADVAGGVPRRPPTKRGRRASVDDAIVYRSRAPEWNEDMGSLTMSFLGSRITRSSTKNYLMCNIAGGA